MNIKKIGLLRTHEYGGFALTADMLDNIVSFNEYGCVFVSVTSPVTKEKGMLNIYDKEVPQNSGTVYVRNISKRVDFLSFMKGDYKKEVDNA